MRDPDFIDEQRNADMLDAMADIEEEKRAAALEYFEEVGDEDMHNTDRSDWWPQDEISSAEKYACDHYNERFVVSVW
jgi:hypothetical protein